jgi:hypothetical protein
MSLNSHGYKIFSDPARRGLAAFAIQLDAMTAAAESSLKDHDRSPTARKLDGRPSISRLLALLDYVLTRHIVSAGMIMQKLGITPVPHATSACASVGSARRRTPSDPCFPEPLWPFPLRLHRCGFGRGHSKQ